MTQDVTRDKHLRGLEKKQKIYDETTYMLLNNEPMRTTSKTNISEMIISANILLGKIL